MAIGVGFLTLFVASGAMAIASIHGAGTNVGYSAPQDQQAQGALVGPVSQPLLNGAGGAILGIAQMAIIAAVLE